MKPKMRIVSIGLLVICLLIMGAGMSGCSSICPKEGKWKTDESVGLIGFTVSECKINFIFITIDLNSADNRFGSVFAQKYKEKNGYTQSSFFPVECKVESDGQFKCEKDNMTLSGKFISEDKAQGELYLPMGFNMTVGFSLKQSINSKWSAAIVK